VRRPPPCRASHASKYCGAPPQRSRAMRVATSSAALARFASGRLASTQWCAGSRCSVTASRSLRRGPCDGTVGVVAELGVPTDGTVTKAHRTACGP
jgi:hypothetical protein